MANWVKEGDRTIRLEGTSLSIKYQPESASRFVIFEGAECIGYAPTLVHAKSEAMRMGAEVVEFELAQFKIGDTVLSKDGRQGVIRYIEADWALVVETHQGKSIRYFCDLQRGS